MISTASALCSGPRRVTVPALVIQADADPLVVPDSGRRLLAGLGSQDKLLVELPFDRHLIVLEEGSEAVFEAVAKFVLRVAGSEAETEEEEAGQREAG